MSDELRTKKETSRFSGLTLEQSIETWGVEDLDTTIKISGEITVAGCERKAFVAELEELCDKYRI